MPQSLRARSESSLAIMMKEMSANSITIFSMDIPSFSIQSNRNAL
jgi:hypothetical protein